MSPGEVELEPEVRDWYVSLDEGDQARVRFHVDRLAGMGPLLGEPYTRQLAGRLRELRFYLAGRPTRVTYWIAPGRRIVLLTVFAKSRKQQRNEVRRAREAMERCMDEAHTAGEEREVGGRKTWEEVRVERQLTEIGRAALEDEERISAYRELVFRLRTEAGFTQAELARRMATTQSAIARMEGGGSRPNLRTLEKLATAVGGDLVVGVGEGLSENCAIVRLRREGRVVVSKAG
jgi:DNA-binding XRE family transcriptional regulator